MEGILIPGDRIVVNKLLYGPALPRSPLDILWFNAFFLLNCKAEAKDAGLEWKYRRLWGLQKIARGDVVVFRYPLSPYTTFVKRCVAMAGDTVEVSNGVLYVNNKFRSFPLNAITEYEVYTHNTDTLMLLADSLQLTASNKTDNTDDCRILDLTNDGLMIIKQSGIADSVKLHLLNVKTKVKTTDSIATWSTDNYGPLAIPQKGMVITVNDEMLRRYKTVLSRYEHFNPQIKNGTYMCNGKPVTHYTFKQDYYFMMGDNCHNSADSRFLGVVPEELITGKAIKILWSGNFTKLKTDRIWKEIK